MKQYKAIYLGYENREIETKKYDSLAVCKRFTKKYNPIRYEEIETHYIYNDNMYPISKKIRIREVR